MSTVPDPAGADGLDTLRGRYDRMRADLQALQAQPVKDLPAIDRLVDALEQLQLRVKAELGIRGNNPNE